MATSSRVSQAEQDFKKHLWESANLLRKNIDAAEYKHIVLGLIFLKYLSDSFEQQRAKLQEQIDAGARFNIEDPDEYHADNVYFVPVKARWGVIKNAAKTPEVGKIIDDAMQELEDHNEQLKGVTPKVYSRENLDATSLGKLVDLFNNVDFTSTEKTATDLLGAVFEYFLGEFALAEGKKGGQFYTPKSVVELLVSMLEPYGGRVLDPCCGSGGMFIQSQRFIKSHSDKYAEVSVFGQESNMTTWKLCKMNLAIHGIDNSQIHWNSEGSLLRDAVKDVKVDYIIANPPFNVSKWDGDKLAKDARWRYGVPPEGNANFAWVQHFVHHLAPGGTAGFVLSKGSMTSNSGGEGEIRRALIEGNLVDCIVNLPAKLFLNTQIPACLWFLSRTRSGTTKHRERSEEILFIEGRDLGYLVNRRTRALSQEDIDRIADTYHRWRNLDGTYEDEAGFCKSASLDEVAQYNFVLTPGRYVGLAEEEDDFDFTERFTSLRAEFEAQLKEEAELNARILENLSKVKMP